MSAEDVKPPDAVYVKQRWISVGTVAWVRECDRIMVDYGLVTGSTVYSKRHQARHRARRLMRLMVELRLHERWELREHTDRQGDGWIWTVEYLGQEEQHHG